MGKDLVVDFYEHDYDEASRLLSGDGLLEFLRTRSIVERHLGGETCKIADIGGGPGVYAEWLSRQGHHVSLVDPSPRHVQAASEREQGSGTIVASVGDACSLDLDDASVDAALFLGPLYHLPEVSDRMTALAEVRRILRPGGRLFAAGISRFASLHDGLANRWLDDGTFHRIATNDLATGRHENPQRHPGWFTTAYFHRPEDLLDEVQQAGFESVSMHGIEGLPGWFSDIDERLKDQTEQAIILEVLDTLGTEPSLLGASAHILAVGERP